MRRTEQERARYEKELKARVRTRLEEVQARTRSNPNWDPNYIFSEDYKKKEEERRFEVAMERDDARQRDLSRVMRLSMSEALSRKRFLFDFDHNLEGDVAYLTDRRHTDSFDHQSLIGIDQRAEHQRVLYETSVGNIAYIQFYRASESIDLRGLTEAQKVLRQIGDAVMIKIDPPRTPKPTLNG